MKTRSLIVLVSVAAIGATGLSGCTNTKTFSTLPSAHSSSPSPLVSPTILSKWTPEQQQVIAGYDEYNRLVTTFMEKTKKINLTDAHQVAKEPYATKFLQNINGTLSDGFVRTGTVTHTVSAVTITGDNATIKTCLDLVHTKFFKPATPSAAPLRTPPPAKATVSLVREGNKWLLSGLIGGQGPCVSG